MVLPSICGDARQSLSLVSLMFAPPLLHMERKGKMNLGFGETATTQFYCVQVFFSEIGYVSMVQIAWGVTG